MVSTDGLTEPIKTQTERLLAAAGPTVWLASGYRSAADQMALRKANCPDPINSPPGDCHPATAKVGTSKHEEGKAVDLDGDEALIAELAPTYGLHRTVPGENWHYEMIPGFVPAPPQEEDDMVRTFIAKSDDPSDQRVGLITVNFSSGVHITDPEGVKWILIVNALAAKAGNAFLVDDNVHAVKASVFRDLIG